MAARTRAKKPSRAELREHALAAASAVGVPEACDVVVVGGGASGLVAAIAAAEAGARACVLEQDLECGRKILATGNGRCNFANESLDTARYRNGAFVAKVAGARWLEEVLGFFGASGLAWTSEVEAMLDAPAGFLRWALTPWWPSTSPRPSPPWTTSPS